MKLSSLVRSRGGVQHDEDDDDDDDFDLDVSASEHHHHHHHGNFTTPTKTGAASATTSKQDRLREKAEEINLVLLEPDVDLWRLRELALSEGGLVNDTIRRRAWPKLVGLNTAKEPELNHPVQVGTPTNAKPMMNNNKSITRITRLRERSAAVHFTGGPLADKSGDSPNSQADSPVPGDGNNSITSYDSICGVGPPVECLDADQIERDVARCTWHLLTGGQRSRRRIMVNKHRKKVARVLRRKQRRLGDLINLTLIQSEDTPGGDETQQQLQQQNQQRLCYYQGYHDVASIFLSALGGASVQEINTYHQKQQLQQRPSSTTISETSSVAEQAASMGLDLPTRVLYQVSMSHFREPMRSNFLQLQTTLRLVLFPLLAALDPELHSHLYSCGMEPFFAISWIITWFSHDIRDTAVVKRLFDVFIVSHPLMPMYLSIAMLCHPSNRREVLSTPCEFAELHNALRGLPKNSSMVGWKYRVGDGYVSEDESVGGDDGATDISLDSDMASQITGASREHGYGNRGDSLFAMGRDHLVLSESHAHVVSMGLPEHVPFQELIDTAISFMRQIPPRKILGIAARYYAWKQASSMLEMAPEISFFQPPPHWALASTAKADWVLKQRAREQRRGRVGQTRKDRRVGAAALRNRKAGTIQFEEMITPIKTNRSKRHHDDDVEDDNDAGDDEKETCTPEMVEKSAKELKWPKAMVAQGFGPGEDEEERRRKRRKMLFVGGAAAVALVAIAVGVSMTYRKPERKAYKPPRRIHSPTSPAARSAARDMDANASWSTDEGFNLPKKASSIEAVTHQKASPSDIVPSITIAANASNALCLENECTLTIVDATNDTAVALEQDTQVCTPKTFPTLSLMRLAMTKKVRMVATNLRQFAHLVENPVVVAVRVKHMVLEQHATVLRQLRMMAQMLEDHRDLRDAAVRNHLKRTLHKLSRDIASMAKAIFLYSIRNAREHMGGDQFDNFLLV